MRRVFRCGIAVGIVLVLLLAGLPLAGSGGDGCCCGPSAKVCPMKQRGMGAVCSIARADACSISKADHDAPAPNERPYAIRAVLVDAGHMSIPHPGRRTFSPYVLAIAAFLAAPVTPPPERR
jgi:hypothetical protein